MTGSQMTRARTGRDQLSKIQADCRLGKHHRLNFERDRPPSRALASGTEVAPGGPFAARPPRSRSGSVHSQSSVEESRAFATTTSARAPELFLGVFHGVVLRVAPRAFIRQLTCRTEEERRAPTMIDSKRNYPLDIGRELRSRQEMSKPVLTVSGVEAQCRPHVCRPIASPRIWSVWSMIYNGRDCKYRRASQR